MSLSRSTAAVAFAAVLAVPAMAAPKASPNSLETVIKKIQEQQARTSTIQADFRQEKELAMLAKPEVSTGTFIYSKPNNVLWTYDAPKRVQMVIAGGTLTTYYPDLNKAERIDTRRYEDRIFKYLGASTGAIDELSKYFDFTFTDKASSPTWLLDLNPKSIAIARRVKHIRIWIDKSTYLASKIEYVEGDGDTTRYEFTNVRVNQPVAQSRFVLSLPPNVHIEAMKLQ
jgi:outer membrane lipoprotein-sorting protein